jgi:2-polyprenyl-3-methyl-5-hydroxy-6-metoxy-1,4-benzoquinol methylase
MNRKQGVTLKSSPVYWQGKGFRKAVSRVLTRIFERIGDERNRVAFSLLELNKSAKVIDFGCWDGEFTLEIGKVIGTTELYGVDIMQNGLKLAMERGIKGLQCDLNKPLPIESETFDAVVSIETLEHVPMTDNFIKEAYRILKPGGYIVITTPNLAAAHQIFALILGLQPVAVMVSDELRVGYPLLSPSSLVKFHGRYPGHYRVFTRNVLKELFEYHGFQVEKIVSVGYLPFPVKIGRIISHLAPRHSAFLVLRARKV